MCKIVDFPLENAVFESIFFVFVVVFDSKKRLLKKITHDDIFVTHDDIFITPDAVFLKC